MPSSSWRTFKEYWYFCQQSYEQYFCVARATLAAQLLQDARALQKRAFEHFDEQYFAFNDREKTGFPHPLRQ